MNYEKALSILGLTPNFTAEELKAAYRRLTHEYHPDKYQNTNLYETMQKKQQEINEAKEILQKNNQIQTHTNDFGLGVYIKEKRSKLESIINYNPNNEIKDEDFNTTVNAITKIIGKFDGITFNPYMLSKEDIDKAYEATLIEIRGKFKNLMSFFYKKHNINKNEVTEKLEYNCSLEEFYEQLLNIEKQFSKKVKVKKQLENEIHTYQSFVGYEALKNIILVIMENAMIKIEEDKYQNISTYIKQMHQEILVIFQIYHGQVRILSELEKIVYVLKNDALKETYQQLKQRFKEGQSLSDTEKDIQNLQKQITEYHKHIEKVTQFKQNEEKMKTIYKKLIYRYYEALTKYNVVTELEHVKKLNKFFDKVLELYSKSYQEMRSIDYINMFNYITFTNLLNDQRIVNMIQNDNSKLYLKSKQALEYSEDDISFFYLEDNDDRTIMYHIEPNDVKEQSISYETLITDYIPLEEIINKDNYVSGYRLDDRKRQFHILYEQDGYVVYLEKGIFKIQVNHTSESQNVGIKTKQYDNPKIVISLIEKQIKKKLKEYHYNKSLNDKDEETSNNYKNIRR